MKSERLLAFCPPVFSFCPLFIVLGLWMPSIVAFRQYELSEALAVFTAACVSLAAALGLGIALTALFTSHMQSREELNKLCQQLEHQDGPVLQSDPESGWRRSF